MRTYLRDNALRGGLAAVGAVALVLGTGLPADAALQTKITCSAVKVRAEPSANATALGVAYEGDTMTYDQWVYKESEDTWYTRGTVKRQDGAEIPRGYVFFRCANPRQDPTMDAPPEDLR